MSTEEGTVKVTVPLPAVPTLDPDEYVRVEVLKLAVSNSNALIQAGHCVTGRGLFIEFMRLVRPDHKASEQKT